MKILIWNGIETWFEYWIFHGKIALSPVPFVLPGSKSHLRNDTSTSIIPYRLTGVVIRSINVIYFCRQIAINAVSNPHKSNKWFYLHKQHNILFAIKAPRKYYQKLICYTAHKNGKFIYLKQFFLLFLVDQTHYEV